MLSLVVLVLIVIVLGLVSSLCIYLLVRSRSSLVNRSKHAVRYSVGPSIDIVTRKLHADFPYRLSLSSVISRRSSMLNPPLTTTPNGLFVSQPIHRRQSSIIDSKQIAQIEFSLPKASETFRRRSVAICNNLVDSKTTTTIDSIIASIKSSNQFLPCLLSFSVIYQMSMSELKIVFHSLMPLPMHVVLQQLTMKIKLIPDGKIKSLQLKKLLDKEKIFDENTEYALRFHGVPSNKLNDKALLIKLTGKDQQKRNVTLGQIGKIEFNQLRTFIDNPRLDFIHEVEKIQPSSIELLVSLEETTDENLLVELQQVKGLKIDQKHLNGTGYFRVVLLDRHRPLSTHQTKSYRLNSSTISMNESFRFNIIAFNATNLDRLMVIITFFSNVNPTREHRSTGRVKLASPFFSAGQGTRHWQEFQEKHAATMWHTLIKTID